MDFETDYDLEAHFDKGQIIKLIESVREIFSKHGVATGVLYVQPRRFRLHLQTNQSITEFMYEVYQMPEVFGVSLGIERAPQILHLDVLLTPNWFEEKHGKNSTQKWVHPEDKGGSLA